MNLFAVTVVIGTRKTLNKRTKAVPLTVKNASFVLPNRSKPTQTPATFLNLLYFQNFRIYFCVRIDIDAQLKTKVICMFMITILTAGWKSCMGQ